MVKIYNLNSPKQPVKEAKWRLHQFFLYLTAMTPQKWMFFLSVCHTTALLLLAKELIPVQARSEIVSKPKELTSSLYGKNPTEHLRIGWQTVEGILPAMPVKKMLKAVEHFCHGLRENQFPLIIGGEHSVTLGVLIALAKKYQPDDVIIVQIDAHLDLREDDSDYNPQPHGRCAHSCVMWRVAELRFRIVNIGARDFSEEESHFARMLETANRFSCFEWSQEETSCLARVRELVLDKHVYLTLDVDGLDPSVMPATGTPVSCGLGWSFTRRLLQRIFQDSKVIGADIVEVIAGPSNTWKQNHTERLTVRNAAQLAYDMCTLHYLNRRS